MHTQTLNRQAYLDSVIQMDHFATLKFAKEALDWWDTYYSWSRDPCLVLYNEQKEVVCYLFYHISKKREYLTIHNIFTPFPHRYHGYAKEMLHILFDTLESNTIERVKLYAVSSSISFYMKLGLDFWGVNEIGQYYSDFPMPKNIADIAHQMHHPHLETLSSKRLQEIYLKLQKNGGDFKESELAIFNQSKDIMQERYRFGEFVSIFERFGTKVA